MNKLRIGMALAALCALLCGAALADLPPAPKDGVDTYVFDYTGSNLISDEDRRVIDEYAGELERQTGAQAVVVLVDFLDGQDAGIYAHNLCNAWNIGQKGKNNGLLLLFARGEREVFLYPGSGIDQMLTPVICDRILGDSAVPKLKNGDYSGGLRDAFLAACNRLAQSYGVSLGGSASSSGNAGGNILEDLFGGLFGSSDDSREYSYEYAYDANSKSNREGGSWMTTLIIIIILFMVLRGSTRRRRYGMGGGGGGWFPFLLGGLFGNMMGRNRGPFSGPTMRPPTGGFRSGGGGGFSRPSGGSKPGGFKPGGGVGRGGGAGRKF